MSQFLNHVAIAAPRNGSATHTVTPSSGTVVAGSAFTPTAGRLLVVVVEGAVTSTTPSGWTLPSGGSAINNTGLYVWYRTAAGSDSLTTTHNGSDYPVVFDFYEYPATATWVGVVSATAVNPGGGAGPTLSGLTGTNQVYAVGGQGTSALFVGPWAGSWSAGTEIVDTSAAYATTDGYTFGVTEFVDDASSTASAAWTSTNGSGATVERLVWAVNVPVAGDPPVPNGRSNRMLSEALPRGGAGLWSEPAGAVYLQRLFPAATGPATIAAEATLTQGQTLTVSAVTTDLGSATLAQSQALTAGAVTTDLGTTSLAQSQTLTANGTRSAVGGSAMSQGSTLTAAATTSGVTSATLTQASTLTGGAVTTSVAAAALAQASSLIAAAVRTAPGATALTQSSTLTTSALSTRTGAAALTQGQVLTSIAGAVQSGAAALTQGATLTAAAARSASGAVVLSQTATLAPSGGRSAAGAANLSQSSTLTSLAVMTLTGTTAFGQVSVLTIGGLVATNGVVQLVAATVLVVGGTIPPSYLPLVDADHMRIVPARNGTRTVEARIGRTVPARGATRIVEARDSTRTVPARPYVRRVT